MDPLHLTLRQLQVFAAVARGGSTAAAGAAIGLSQSATSAALKELERMLGTPKDIEDFTKRFGDAAGIPSMSVGQQTVSGLETGAWNNLLDLAGYPKTAPYGSQPAISSPQ